MEKLFRMTGDEWMIHADDRWMEARMMEKEIKTIVREITEDQEIFKKSYRRMKDDSYKRFKNPIACSKCILCSTCVKRVAKGLTKCPNGIQKKVKKAA